MHFLLAALKMFIVWRSRSLPLINLYASSLGSEPIKSDSTPICLIFMLHNNLASRWQEQRPCFVQLPPWPQLDMHSPVNRVAFPACHRTNWVLDRTAHVHPLCLWEIPPPHTVLGHSPHKVEDHLLKDHFWLAKRRKSRDWGLKKKRYWGGWS